MFRHSNLVYKDKNCNHRGLCNESFKVRPKIISEKAKDPNTMRTRNPMQSITVRPRSPQPSEQGLNLSYIKESIRARSRSTLQSDQGV